MKRAAAIDERRASQREATRRNGLVIDAKSRVVSCIIRDVSEGGARVALQAEDVEGDEVILVDHNLGTEHKARLVWRSKTQIGLCFIGPARRGRPRVGP